MGRVLQALWGVARRILAIGLPESGRYTRETPKQEETKGRYLDAIRPRQVHPVLRTGTRVLGGTRRWRCNSRMLGCSGSTGLLRGS